MFSCLSINYDFCHCDFCLVRCCTIIGLGQYIHLIIKLFYMVSWHPYIAPDVCDGQCSCFQAWSNQHIVCHPWQDHTICLWSTLMARCLDHGCWTFDLRSLQHQHAFPKSSSGSEAIGSSLGSNSPWTAVLFTLIGLWLTFMLKIRFAWQLFISGAQQAICLYSKHCIPLTRPLLVCLWDRYFPTFAFL